MEARSGGAGEPVVVAPASLPSPHTQPHTTNPESSQVPLPPLPTDCQCLQGVLALERL